jgi:hypothetical protein
MTGICENMRNHLSLLLNKAFSSLTFRSAVRRQVAVFGWQLKVGTW